MLILGIETSCDETSAAVVKDGRDILSNIVASQVDLHAKYGGVVPELASRKHVELVNPVIREALDTAKIDFQDINAVAVTNRPGLVGALLIGVSAAKAISSALQLPLLGIHHIEGHIYANLLKNPSLPFPFICLVVSGGHSDLLLIKDHGSYEMLARTRDDAAGEAFDKTARAIGLGYPGGPMIDKLAQKGNPEAIRFPRARLGNTLDFSFSGIKTAVARFYKENKENHKTEDIAASFQAAMIDMLANNTLAAAQRTGIKNIALAGGVAANSGLQERISREAEKHGLQFNYPPTQLCTDNAAMIACAGYYHLIRGETDTLDMDTRASEPLVRQVNNKKQS